MAMGLLLCLGYSLSQRRPSSLDVAAIHMRTTISATATKSLSWLVYMRPSE
jgi:hypothetical protein